MKTLNPLLLILFTSTLLASPSEKPLRIYIHALTKARTVSAADSILAERVYIKYFPNLKSWLYAKTDERSQFAKPSETLQKGSVLPGLQIGANDILAHYKLLASGYWEQTTEPLKEYLRIDAKKPFVKVVLYDVPSGPTPQAPPPPKGKF